MSKPWFRQKRYGFGLTPCSWEGWALCLIFFIAAVGSAHFALSHGGRITAGLAVGVLLVGFVALAFAKSEGKPGWRWGSRG